MRNIKKVPVKEKTSVRVLRMGTKTETQTSLFVWVRVHKNQLIFAGISVAAILAAVLGAANRDTITALWDQLIEAIEESSMYSSKWFANATTETLETEREKIRMEYLSSGNDLSVAIGLQNLLWQFDRELTKRAWNGQDPRGPSTQREHGWYLPNDD